MAGASVVDPATQARLQRSEYWRAVAEREDGEHLGSAVSAKPRYALQWHPRVRGAVRLIEKLAGGRAGEKVLVFGEYLDSLHALSRSEGINLHRACRTVVLFHLDWNPGRIEQQIGRVDRQNSAWMNACEKALRNRVMPP